MLLLSHTAVGQNSDLSFYIVIKQQITFHKYLILKSKMLT